MADPIRTVLVEQKLIYEERIAELIKERDEARRIACGLMYDQATSPNTTKQSIAEAEGWDCFAENTNG